MRPFLTDVSHKEMQSAFQSPMMKSTTLWNREHREITGERSRLTSTPSPGLLQPWSQLGNWDGLRFTWGGRGMHSVVCFEFNSMPN